MVHRHILGTRVDAVSQESATERILSWARDFESRYVCFANVHMVMEAHRDSGFRKILNGADLVAPDGVPLVWMLRALGSRGQQRVCGPDLVPRILAEASKEKIAVGVYGGHPTALARFTERITDEYPELKICYAYSPPFREPSPDEDANIISEINNSGARILLVVLGCPRQERWMAEHKHKIHTVMLGVGAALDFLSGEKPRAPRLLQKAGLEWAFRLMAEPRRLWKRYLLLNPVFVMLALYQLARKTRR